MRNHARSSSARFSMPPNLIPKQADNKDEEKIEIFMGYKKG